jgi:hypothetical protein
MTLEEGGGEKVEEQVLLGMAGVTEVVRKNGVGWGSRRLRCMVVTKRADVECFRATISIDA